MLVASYRIIQLRKRVHNIYELFGNRTLPSGYEMEKNRNIDLEKLRASLLKVQTIYTTSLLYWIEDLLV